MSNWRNIEIGKVIDFNPIESIKKGTVAKKIPMDKLTPFEKKIKGFDFSEYNAGPKFRNGDTLVAKITPCLENGKTAQVDILEENEVAYGSSEFIVLRENENTINDFIFYLAKSPAFRKRAIICMEGTSGRKRVNEGALKLQVLPIPDKITQQKIAKALSDLDAKIELNNKINNELEAMAKTLYDYWFVQFDFPSLLTPKGEMQPYKSSGGKMVWNEELKREIPEGWEVEKLGNLGNFKNGVNYDPSNPGEVACPIINVRNISSSSYFIKNEDLDIIHLTESDVRKYSVHEGSIIIARSGIPGATRLISDIEKHTLYCGFAIHYELIDLKLKSRVFFFLKSIEQMIKNGSGGTILKNVNQATLNELKITIPNVIEIIDEFNNKISPIFSKINLIQKENKQLASLRDWLLPMLMNGQVTIGEVAEGYDVEDEVLGLVAEDKSAYENDKDAIDSLFQTINYDYEIGVVVLLTRQVLDRTYGKKYIHKMFSNIIFLESLPVFEDLKFQENGWGMYCPVIERTIKNAKYITFEDVNDKYNVINFNYKYIKEVTEWMKQKDNESFVSSVYNMLSIYKKSLISKNMDRIELFNTVLQCMNVLETDDFDKICYKMRHWKMYEDGFSTKAEKFKPEETRMMIEFIKKLV